MIRGDDSSLASRESDAIESTEVRISFCGRRASLGAKPVWHLVVYKAHPTTPASLQWTRPFYNPVARSVVAGTHRELPFSAYQFERDFLTFAAGLYSLWLHPLLIPSYAALASILVLILQIIFSFSPIKALRARISTSTEGTSTSDEHSASSTRTGLLSAVKDHVERSGGSVIFIFHLSRLVLVLSLLVLSIFCFLQEEALHSADSGLSPLNKHWGKWRKKPKHRNGGGGGGSFSKREWLDLAACLNYVCLLATLNVACLIDQLFLKLKRWE